MNGGEDGRKKGWRWKWEEVSLVAVMDVLLIVQTGPGAADEGVEGSGGRGRGGGRK